MGTTADKLNKLIQTKNEIKQALQDKGVEVGDKFSDYADKVEEVVTKVNPLRITWRNPTLISDGDFVKKNMIGIDVTNLITSKDKYLRNMFEGCGALQTITGLDTWDTSGLLLADKMFNACCLVGTYDLRNWDMSNVTSMASMFFDCGYSGAEYHFDLRNWDVRKVTNMEGVFDLNHKTATFDIRGWQTDALTRFSFGRFCFDPRDNNERSLNDMILGIKDLNVSKVTYFNMYDCGFEYADLGGWNTSSMTDVSMNWCRRMITLNLDGWDFSNVTAFNIVLDWKLANLEGNFSGLGNKMNTVNFNLRYNENLSSLSNDSIRNIVNALVDKSGVSGTFTLQLARELQSNIPDDIIAAASAKNWNIAFT